jgi:hypothetical protein
LGFITRFRGGLIMKCIVKAVLGVQLVLGVLGPGAGVARAFDNSNAPLSLHLVRVTPGGPNSCVVPGLRASQMQTQTNQFSTPDGPFYYVYLLACSASDSTKVGGFECGIQYPGSYNPGGNPAGPITIFSWTRCATMEFPSGGWPASGGGNVMTWSAANCPGTRSEPGIRYSVIAIGGYFYLGAYSAARMYVTARPVTGRAGIADCQSRVDFVEGRIPPHLGSAGFGMNGLNVCGIIEPVQPTTWSAIKGAYDR